MNEQIQDHESMHILCPSAMYKSESSQRDPTAVALVYYRHVQQCQYFPFPFYFMTALKTLSLICNTTALGERSRSIYKYLCTSDWIP